MDSYWHDRPVLVTGAGGFIASHLVESLVRQGARVRAFVRYNSRGDPGLLRLLPADCLEQVEIIAGDLRDLPAVQAAMRRVSLVFHLGALISIPYSYRHPAEVVETNVIGTLNILLAGRDGSVERVVHTSTSEVYGSALRVPIDENHPLQGQSPYSASKIGADKLAESFYCAYDLPVVTVRPFNTYGPRQSARAVIPTIITQALAQDVIRLGNLETRRDFTYVSDTVRGFLLAAQTPAIEGEYLQPGRRGRNYHRRPGAADHPPDREEGADRSRGRTAATREERSAAVIVGQSIGAERLGWEPKVGLEEGLGEMIRWIEEHLELYQPGVYQF